jgi:hypothetical protein
MSGIDEEHVSFVRSSRRQGRFQLRAQEFRLNGDVFLDRFLGGQGNGALAAPLQAESFFKNRRTWVGPYPARSTPEYEHALRSPCVAAVHEMIPPMLGDVLRAH